MRTIARKIATARNENRLRRAEHSQAIWEERRRNPRRSISRGPSLYPAI
jgi:hypothetical protein